MCPNANTVYRASERLRQADTGGRRPSLNQLAKRTTSKSYPVWPWATAWNGRHMQAESSTTHSWPELWLRCSQLSTLLLYQVAQKCAGTKSQFGDQTWNKSFASSIKTALITAAIEWVCSVSTKPSDIVKLSQLFLCLFFSTSKSCLRTSFKDILHDVRRALMCISMSWDSKRLTLGDIILEIIIANLCGDLWNSISICLCLVNVCKTQQMCPSTSPTYFYTICVTVHTVNRI